MNAGVGADFWNTARDLDYGDEEVASFYLHRQSERPHSPLPTQYRARRTRPTPDWILGNLVRLSAANSTNERASRKDRVLPGGHPSLALSLWDLAVVHKARKQYEKALPMVEEAHAIWSAAHGLEHEDTRDAAGHGIAAVDIG